MSAFFVIAIKVLTMMNEITKGVWYIGVDDCELDLFEGLYRVPQGVSYNSYLIVDDRVAIMDSVDSRKCDEWLAILDTALSGRKPDYLVVQHMEPDHTGSLLALVQRYPDIAIVATQRAIDMLPQFFENTALLRNLHPVQEGDTLPLGEHTLQFLTAPMVHWPEVMCSYECKEGILFSADAFGKFGALSHEEEWVCEARRYYFNICGKYGAAVQSLLRKVAQLDVKYISPLHGPVLSGELDYYIGLYDTWSRYEAECKGVFVAYASIYGGTATAAKQVAEMLRARGVERVVIADLCRDDMAEAVEDAFRMSHMVLAAASYDGDLFPPMHTFLHHLQMKGFCRRRVGIIENGSWAPCAGRIMRTMLERMKDVDIVEPMVTIRSTLKSGDFPKLEALADALVAK